MSRSEANKFLISKLCSFCRFRNATRRIFPCIGTFSEQISPDLENIESYWSPLTLASNYKCEGDNAKNACCHLCLPIEPSLYYWIMVSRLSGMQHFMCETHCKEKCRCGPCAIGEGWRCLRCFLTTLVQLDMRGRNFKRALRYRQTTTTFATQEPTFKYSAEEPGLEETCYMMDYKERVWDDVENPAFLLFCACCSTIYKGAGTWFTRRS